MRKYPNTNLLCWRTFNIRVDVRVLARNLVVASCLWVPHIIVCMCPSVPHPASLPVSREDKTFPAYQSQKANSCLCALTPLPSSHPLVLAYLSVRGHSCVITKAAFSAFETNILFPPPESKEGGGALRSLSRQQPFLEQKVLHRSHFIL